MRTYINTLLFENILDFPPVGDANVLELYNSVVTPMVSIVEANCGTTSGELEDISYSIVGETELATNTPLTRNRIVQLVSQGIYKINLANTASCISTGGICQRCHTASYPTESVPAVGSKVRLYPEHILRVDVSDSTPGQKYFTLLIDPSYSKKILVYVGGVLLTSGYTISGTSLTLASPPLDVTDVVVKYVSDYNPVFMKYLASTYSGSLVGIKPLVGKLGLPIKSKLLTSIIDVNTLEMVRDKIKNMQSVPQDYRDYIGSVDKNTVHNPLEDAILLLVLYNMYNV